MTSQWRTIATYPCGSTTNLGRNQRGSAMLWSAVVVGLMTLLGVLLLAVGVLTARGHAVQGAADLAALAGVTAQLAGRDACAAVRKSASLNDSIVTACTVAGDEIEVVVTVDTQIEVGVGLWRTTLAGHANAGVITGSPQ